MLLPNVALAAAAALLVPALTGLHLAQLLALCTFECCVGVYYPCMSSLRARLIPSEVRSTIMGLFRVPLNLIVVLVLLNVSRLSELTITLVSVALLVSAFAALRFLQRLVGAGAGASVADAKGAGVPGDAEVSKA